MFKYKRISLSALMTLVILFSSVFLFGGQANAEALGGLFSRQSEIDYSSNIVFDKSKKVDVITAQAQSVADTKNSLTRDVATLQTQIANLNDMFVHINKYAPDSAGNTYTPGNCTWYVKSRRPDIPNSLGNANTWYARAEAQGWDVGSKPKKGAVGTSTAGWLGHVVYVEGVSPDGQWVTISEMNFEGLYSMNTRTVYYTTFKYIYELN